MFMNDTSLSAQLRYDEHGVEHERQDVPATV